MWVSSVINYFTTCSVKAELNQSPMSGLISSILVPQQGFGF